MPDYTLSQIKAHPNFPFGDFRDNPMSFLMVELYWVELFSEVVGDAVSEVAILGRDYRDVDGLYRLVEEGAAGGAGVEVLRWHEIDTYLGGGAYVCGESSAIIQSIEGKVLIPVTSTCNAPRRLRLDFAAYNALGDRPWASA